MKRVALILALLLGVFPAALGQQISVTGPGFYYIGPVSGLPTNANKGTPAWVTDGASSTDCVTGGGTTVVSCGYNGTAWAATGGGGGGGTPGGLTTQVQFNDAGAFAGNANLTFDKVTGILTHSVTSRFKGPDPYIDVKAYGAVGDAVADDTTAIQNALNAIPAAGGTVYFPTGKYKITAGLTLSPTNGQGIKLMGAGPAGGGPGTGAGGLAASQIYVSGTDVIALKVGTNTTFSYNGPTIENLGFHEVTAGTSGGAIELINQSYAKLDRVMVEGFTKAGLAAPAAPTLAVAAGGSLASATFNVKVSYNNPQGETLASTASTIATSGTCPTSGNCTITVTSPAASGNATSYNVYVNSVSTPLYLQLKATGPTTLATNASITSLDATGFQPLNFDQSKGYGVKIRGTMGGYGASTAFANQPILIDFQTTSGTLNGVVSTRSVSDLTMKGGNINQGSATSGCGVMSTGPAHIQTHAENGGSGATHFCFQGIAGEASVNIETGGGVAGIKAIDMDKWNIQSYCAAISGAGLPINLDSTSSRNVIWAHSNGTCAYPMVTDAGLDNTKFEDSTTPTMSFGVPLSSTSTGAGNLQLYDSGGTNSVTLTAPSSVSPSYTWTLPGGDAAGLVASDGAGTISIKPASTKIYLIAAGCDNVTAAAAWDLPTASAAGKACLGTGPRFGVLTYADAATSSAYTHFRLPADWTGAIDLTLLYTGDTSSVNNIVWQPAESCVADGADLLAATFTTTASATGAGPTTAGQRKSLAFTGMTTTGCAAGSLMFLRLQRLGADAGDTYTGVGQLLGVEVTLRRTL